MKKKVSVVVLNWNGKKYLRKCLNSLRKVIYSPLEVIVVDNNSKDGSWQMVAKDFPWAKLIKNKKNFGYSAGNNKGIKKSIGDYVFILNNDTQVTKKFLEPLISLMESDTTIGCAQPKILYGTDHEMLNAVGSFFTSVGILYHYGYRKNAKLVKYNKPLKIYSAKGAAMLFRRSALKKVGLFDEDFFIFFEETDLCHRLWLAGYKIIYEPKSTIYHYEAIDTSKQMKEFRRTYLSFKNRITSYLKNLEWRTLIKTFCLMLPIYFLLFSFYLLTLKPDLSLAIVAGLGWNIINLPKILKKRRFIQEKLRKLPDKELLPLIKKDPPPVYYYYLFTYNLNKFTYEKSL